MNITLTKSHDSELVIMQIGPAKLTLFSHEALDLANGLGELARLKVTEAQDQVQIEVEVL